MDRLETRKTISTRLREAATKDAPRRLVQSANKWLPFDREAFRAVRELFPPREDRCFFGMNEDECRMALLFVAEANEE